MKRIIIFIILVLLFLLVLFFYPKKYYYAPVNFDTGPTWDKKCLGFESIEMGPPGGGSKAVCYGFYYHINR